MNDTQMIRKPPEMRKSGGFSAISGSLSFDLFFELLLLFVLVQKFANIMSNYISDQNYKEQRNIFQHSIHLLPAGGSTATILYHNWNKMDREL